VPSSFQLILAGAPATDAFLDRVSWIEAEENADVPGSLQLRVPIWTSTDGELNPLNDSGLQPMANVALVATPSGGSAECIFDGYVLGHKIHLESGVAAAWVEVHGQDASWLMNVEEKSRVWTGMTDGTVANTIFGEYGFTPGPDNLTDDSPAHTEETHTLMQRATDLQFLLGLARRGGRHCRVVAGSAPGQRTGIFATPALEAQAAATLSLNDPATPNIAALDLEWDVMRPSKVVARQALFSDASSDGATGDATQSGFAAMDARDLPTFAGGVVTAMLSTPVDDAGTLAQRAAAMLRDAGWFVRVTGDVDAAALHVVLRVGQIVQLTTLGSVHSGKYLVWSVRHRIGKQAHRMSFVLVRNAVGAPPGGGGVLPGGLP
jgi:phage protein D